MNHTLYVNQIPDNPTTISHPFSLNYIGPYRVKLTLQQKDKYWMSISSNQSVEVNSLPTQLTGSVSIKNMKGDIIKSKNFDLHDIHTSTSRSILIFWSPKHVLKHETAYLELKFFELNKGFREEYEKIHISINKSPLFFE